MVLAYHVILTMYGFWLPNDPRGSWSDVVREWELLRFGPATKVTTRRSVATRAHDRALRRAAKAALRYPPVRITGVQAVSMANGFVVAINQAGYVVYACSILPDHVHLVVARHDRPIEGIVPHLKAKATMRLRADGRHPMALWPRADGSLPSPWARNFWAVYLDRKADIARAVRYVEGNPGKEGLTRQAWPFVTRSRGCDAARRSRGAYHATLLPPRLAPRLRRAPTCRR